MEDLTDIVLARLATVWPSRKTGLIIAALFLIAMLPLLGYYVAGYYSANRATLQIVSGVRTLGHPIEYLLDVRLSFPGALTSVEVRSPCFWLVMDSYDLMIICGHDDTLNAGAYVDYRFIWRSSNSNDPTAETTLGGTNTNHLLLSMYTHPTSAGWYSGEITRSLSTSWTWSS